MARFILPALLMSFAACGAPDRPADVRPADAGPRDLLEEAGATALQMGWRAIDGDTLESPSGERIRIADIQAPEFGDRAACEAEHTLATWAQEEAQRLLSRASKVRVSELGRDRYGRIVGRVSLQVFSANELEDFFYSPDTVAEREWRDFAGAMLETRLAKPWPHSGENHGRALIPEPTFCGREDVRMAQCVNFFGSGECDVEIPRGARPR